MIKYHMKLHNPKQQGVAIIMAMLIVALVVVTVTAMITSSHRALRRAENMKSGEQAYLAALSVESFARVWLRLNITNPPEYARTLDTVEFDYLGETWAQHYPPADHPEWGTLPTSDGEIIGTYEVHIDDRQGCLNLNNIYTAPRDQTVPATPEDEIKEKRAKFWLDTLTNLIGSLGLDQHVGPGLFIDWLDNDMETTYSTGAPGAEDPEYMSMDPPYRASGTRFVDISELRLLKDMLKKVTVTDPVTYAQTETTVFERLKPYICVLPTNNTVLNVNTAPALLLGAMFGVNATDFEERAQAKEKDKAFPKPDDFTKLAPVDRWVTTKAESNPQINKNDPDYQKKLDDEKEKIRKGLARYISTKSEFFWVQSEVKVGRNKSRLQSLIYRPPNGQGKTQVLMRRQGDYEKPAANTEQDANASTTPP